MSNLTTINFTTTQNYVQCMSTSSLYESYTYLIQNNHQIDKSNSCFSKKSCKKLSYMYKLSTIFKSNIKCFFFSIERQSFRFWLSKSTHIYLRTNYLRTKYKIFTLDKRIKLTLPKNA